jgi:hypothetical protein
MGIIQDMCLNDTHKGREALSKAKGILKKAKARTLETPFEATTRALDAVGERDAQGFFGHCGYATPQAH